MNAINDAIKCCENNSCATGELIAACKNQTNRTAVLPHAEIRTDKYPDAQIGCPFLTRELGRPPAVAGALMPGFPTRVGCCALSRAQFLNHDKAPTQTVSFLRCPSSQRLGYSGGSSMLSRSGVYQCACLAPSVPSYEINLVAMSLCMCKLPADPHWTCVPLQSCACCLFGVFRTQRKFPRIAVQAARRYATRSPRNA